MKFITFLFMALFAAASCSAQDFIFNPDKKAKPDRELYNEGREKTRNLLLIPYMPVMHLPDPAGDVELMINSGKELKDLYHYVRTALDMQLKEKFETGYSVTSLLIPGNDDSKKDLERIYGSVAYDYTQKPQEKDTGKFQFQLPKTMNPSGNSPGKDAETKIEKGQLKSSDADRSKEYMNVIVKDTSLIAFIANKYEADILVFINQVELKKAFAQGEDLPYGIYRREVKVHYSMLNIEEKQWYGNSAVRNVDTKSDDINEIMNQSFPPISEDLFNHLPAARPDDMQKLDKEYQKKAEKQDVLRKD